MTFGLPSHPCTCSVCTQSFPHAKKLSEHVRSSHGLSSVDYVIKCVHAGTRPTCPVCGSDTRFVSITVGFKKYCKDHGSSSGGKAGGKVKRTWNKGLTKHTDPRLAEQASLQTGPGNPFFGHRHTDETKASISATKTLGADVLEQRIDARGDEFKLVTLLDDYFSRQHQYLEFECLKCGTHQPKTLQAFERGSRCYVCFPVAKSNWELEVLDFVRHLGFEAVSGDRTVLAPKEIDVYVPHRRLGIECHGLYWHSDGSPRGPVDVNSHLQKLELACVRGILLLQLFEDEWRDKREICQSLIMQRLGVLPRRVDASTLDLVELSVEEQQDFFGQHHIKGHVPGFKAFGLVNGLGQLFAAMNVFVSSRQGFEGFLEFEYCSAAGVDVVGGLERLLVAVKQHAFNLDHKGLLTCIDRRFDVGSYIEYGFIRVGTTEIDCFCTDGAYRYLVDDTSSMARIHGCGFNIYQLVHRHSDSR